ARISLRAYARKMASARGRALIGGIAADSGPKEARNNERRQTVGKEGVLWHRAAKGIPPRHRALRRTPRIKWPALNAICHPRRDCRSRRGSAYAQSARRRPRAGPLGTRAFASPA